MASSLHLVYDWARRWSRMGVFATLLLVSAFNIFNTEISLTTQLTIALIALLVGIPHGAIDHLISIPRKPNNRFFAYILIYVVIAVIAGLLIATWNVNGFRAVVLMSALHFGFGDASFINERKDAYGKPRRNFVIETIYAIPAGFLPVVLPLTGSRTASALKRIHPALLNWDGGAARLIRNIVLISFILALVIFTISKKFDLIIDLVLLAALSIFAPPLIAFATYFGFWHALRHTARLVPKLEKSRNLADSGEWQKAITGAIVPGLYAVFGTLLLAAILMITIPEKFSSSLLWSTLLIIWALTVPHMISTARFDLKVIK